MDNKQSVVIAPKELNIPEYILKYLRIKMSDATLKENEKETTYKICRLNFDCVDDKNECPFCSINRTESGNWYAKCKLYNKRLKQCGKYHIAVCCSDCIKIAKSESKK